jgi:Tfp pilus assembly protein PilF
LKLDPTSSTANFYQGILLQRQGNTEEARKCYERAIELDPEYAPPQVNLGVLLMNENRHEQALAAFAEALRIDPMELRARFNSGLVYERMGQSAAAIEEFRQVIEHAPDNHASRLKLGMLLASEGKRHEAMDHFRYILSKQDDPSAHAELAAALVAEGDPHSALQHYGQALRQASPVWAAIAGRAAWLLATHPADDVRDGRQAVMLAEAACRQTEYQSAELLESLAAAKAEVGDFREAVTRAEQAHERAVAAGDSQRATTLEEQLRGYRQERPFRTPRRVTANETKNHDD